MGISELEHVTKYFYNNFLDFKIKNLKSNKKKNLINLSIDTKKDMYRIKKLIKLKNK